MFSHSHHAFKKKKTCCLFSGCPGAFGQCSAMLCASQCSAGRHPNYISFTLEGLFWPVTSSRELYTCTCILVHKSFYRIDSKVFCGENVPANLLVTFIHYIRGTSLCVLWTEEGNFTHTFRILHFVPDYVRFVLN